MSITDYLLQRNAASQETFSESTADQDERMKELQKEMYTMGFRSAPKRKVQTEGEIKSAKESKHAESNLQLKCCRWVKKWYQDDRYYQHKREGARTGFNRAVFGVMNANVEGYPDHEFPDADLKIEFKQPGEDWLLKDGKTVKTAYRHQYRCHEQLWAKGEPVYFCNDFDKFRELYKAAKEGKHLPQQVYVCPEKKQEELF